MDLNAKQIELLRLIERAGDGGAIVFGQPYSTTAGDMHDRGLIEDHGIVNIVSMGAVYRLIQWAITPRGIHLLRDIDEAAARDAGKAVQS